MDRITYQEIVEGVKKRESRRHRERICLADLERRIMNEYLLDKNRDKRKSYYDSWEKRIASAYEAGLEEDKKIWALRKRLYKGKQCGDLK